MREIAKLWSDDMQRMRLQIDGFTYEKQSWFRQTEAFNKQLSDLQEQLRHNLKYMSQLEECCGSAGFPVAAIRQTFSRLTTSGRRSESDDEVLCATANRTPSAVLAPAGRGGARVKHGHCYIEDEDPSDSDSSPVLPPRIRERRPNRTRSSKSARIAVLKMMTSANGDETTVSRSLTCNECASHKNIVGELPRKGPFEPYWNRLMLQTAAFKLEHRDVWQIVLITLPSELMHHATAPLLSGTIVDPVGGEMDAEVYERLKQTLLELRGPPRTAWDKIMQTKQARD
ncbi:hypothetical protein AAFF_G00147620 [Aldrovandia affinis]|uniref:Uncharacterized protein n=1 Tax=Aldrovandia affinis TaxID=143900 RepID=A0AAD7W8K4_9TELE|nr:hypothetical protein AAFF_G00147620 [Aldrovandia affinis]